MSRNIPVALILCRLMFGILILTFAWLRVSEYRLWMVLFLALGLVTDVLDGIIARKLNVATATLRRLDSGVDQIFFVSAAVAAYILCPEFFREHAIALIVLVAFELLTYVISFLKFRKEIATHSWGAKFWTLILFATLVQLMVSCQSNGLFQVCFWVGIITRLEIMAIVLFLRSWTNDVPSVYHALKLRQGAGQAA